MHFNCLDTARRVSGFEIPTRRVEKSVLSFYDLGGSLEDCLFLPLIQHDQPIGIALPFLQPSAGFRYLHCRRAIQ
jgi:hypothetical protein